MRYVKDYMSTEPVWVESGSSLRAAAVLMVRRNVGSLLVGDGQHVDAIVTEVDIVGYGVAEDRDPDSATVGEIAKRPVVTVETGRPVEQAGELFAEHVIRHVVVTRDHKVVGMLSIRDLLPIVTLLPLTVERMMADLPVVVPSLETVRNVAVLLTHARGSAVLVAGGRLKPRGVHQRGFGRSDIAGIVTVTDLVRDVVAKGLDSYVTTVGSVMSGPVYTVEQGETISTAFDIMSRGGVRHLGVSSGDELIGLLSVEDVIEPAWLHVAAGTPGRARESDRLRDA